MNYAPELLLVAAVAGVGVLHTIVPDHWVPITLLARQRGWSKSETARASLQAGTGHVLSTLFIALVVWIAGVAFAERFGHLVDTVASLALVAFGGWIGITAWRDLRSHGGHGHSHNHGIALGHPHDDGDPNAVHGPELQRIKTKNGVLELSIFEAGVPPRFRLSGATADAVTLQTRRDGDERQHFMCANHGTYWESVEEIPEPHQFAVSVIIERRGDVLRYETHFTEHDHGHHAHDQADGHDHGMAPEDDPLYAPLRGETAELTRHVHIHRHGRGSVHEHWHDHTPASSHATTDEAMVAAPAHDHRHKTTARTALLLILGSSPMVEGIPAFFAAGKYGVGLIVVMAIVFAISTIATYVLLCVYSTAGLQRVRLGAVERYGEVLSGAFIALVGLAFWTWPVR
jgi:hypothetical protein